MVFTIQKTVLGAVAEAGTSPLRHKPRFSVFILHHLEPDLGQFELVVEALELALRFVLEGGDKEFHCRVFVPEPKHNGKDEADENADDPQKNNRDAELGRSIAKPESPLMEGYVTVEDGA